MAHLHLYFTVCLLLLTWSYSRTVAFPVHHDASKECANCAPLFKSLLLDVSGLLKNDVLWHGISFKVKSLPINSSETVLACAPALNKTRCQLQSKKTFNESECLKNILKDLVYYEDIIRSYIQLDLRSPDEEVPPLRQTLQTIHNLLHACSLAPTEETSLKDSSGLWVDSSYSNRQKMLMMMKAFYVRTITFNRAVGYIASGEHKKSHPS